VGVADLGFCYADSRQTGSGYYPKTFVAWRTTLQNKPGLLSLLKTLSLYLLLHFSRFIIFVWQAPEKQQKHEKTKTV
jgi:hypothetical protein